MADERTDADEKIQQDVLAELRWHGRIHPNEIGVTVKDGIVTLSGKINSLANKWAAEEAARRVGGVKAVANDLEVRLPIEFKRTDSDIAAAAVHALDWDIALPTERIQVTVSDGWIELSGRVRAYWEKEEAEDAVKHLRGVRGVTTRILVRPEMQASAGATKAAIEDALVRDARTDAQGIKVEVHGSTVTLKGTVRSLAEKDAAERVACSAPGITYVDNCLVVSFSV